MPSSRAARVPTPSGSEIGVAPVAGSGAGSAGSSPPSRSAYCWTNVRSGSCQPRARIHLTMYAEGLISTSASSTERRSRKSSTSIAGKITGVSFAS